jgi:methanogen homocitrate synthase
MVVKDLPEMPLHNVPFFDDNRFVSPWNFEPGVHPATMSKSVYIHDVTLRDGEQTPGVVWKNDERIRIALALDEIGVQEIEVGMPIVPEVAATIRQLIDMKLKARIVPFARARQDDLDAALDCGAKAIVVEHCLNPYLVKHAYGLDYAGLIDRCVTWTAYAKEKGLRTTFMGWDVTRAPVDYALRVYKEIVRQAKPDALVITDSYGLASPLAMFHVMQLFRQAFPSLPLELHIHNEFGMAVGAVVAAIAAGVNGVHTSMNGLGERTGNVPTEEVVACLQIDLGIDTGIDMSKFGSLSRMIREMSKVDLAPNKPVVGWRLYKVESGVVTHAITKMQEAGFKAGTFPFTPELVGQDPIEFVLGAGTGRNTIQFFLSQVGIHATDEQADEILTMVHDEGRVRKGLLKREDLQVLAKKVIKG